MFIPLGASLRVTDGAEPVAWQILHPTQHKWQLRGYLLRMQISKHRAQGPETLLSHPACIYHPFLDTASDHGLIHPSSREVPGRILFT